MNFSQGTFNKKIITNTINAIKINTITFLVPQCSIFIIVEYCNWNFTLNNRTGLNLIHNLFSLNDNEYQERKIMCNDLFKNILSNWNKSAYTPNLHKFMHQPINKIKKDV